jgi:hypothetical protein
MNITKPENRTINQLKESKMTNLFKLSFVMIFVILLLTACSKEDNPMAPSEPGNGEDPIEIQTPTHLKITQISLTRFPTNKSNGDKWDYSVFPNSPTRRPDIYVELGKSSGGNHVYRSDIREDVIFETAYDELVFTKPASSDDGSLLHNVAINQTYTIKVWDDDGITADDSMGRVNINTAGYYNNDNATFVFKTLTSGE